MKNKRKKEIIFFIVWIIIILNSNFCYAETITQEEFKNNFTKTIEGKHRANIEENKINLQLMGSDKEVCTIYYELTQNPTFTMEMNFNGQMTFHEYAIETAKYTYFSYCIMALKSYLIKDVGEYPAIYFGNATDSLVENNNIEEENYTSDMAITSTKENFKDKTIEDENFKLTFKTKEDISSKFEMEAVLELKSKTTPEV